jgi:thioesterase domain-containing protein
MSISMTLRRSDFMLNGPLVPAGTPLEATIMSAFRDTFELDEVGAEDDFFELGGDSLSAEVLTLNIRKQTGRDFDISWVVKNSTPRAIASLLEHGAPKPAVSRRPPLFMVHGTDGVMMPSKEFLDGFAPDQRLEIFEMPGIRDQGEVLTSITEIAAHYLVRLKAAYPAGPVLLGGTCKGSLIAIEMAAQLADAGRPVHQLLLIDPSVPDNVRRYMERSAGVELPWRARAMQWRHRIMSLLLLGRASDGSEEADFDDDRLRRLRVRINRRRHAKRKRKGIASREYPGIAISEHAKAILRAAYSHYKPRPFSGEVDVISSGQQRTCQKPGINLWGILLPRRRIHVVTARHSDLFGAQAGETAATLQRCIDQAIEKIPAGPRAPS